MTRRGFDRVAARKYLAFVACALTPVRGAPERGTSEDAPREAHMETPQPNRGDKTSSGARGTKAHG
jgi:hypothetical protein